MSRLRSLSLASFLIVAGAAGASAESYGYGSNGYGYRPLPDQTDMRQARQLSRIEQGYRDGSLTSREAAGLMDQQRQIADYERRAKSDGFVDPYERATLRGMQESAGRSIRHERTDFEGRNAALDRPWWRRWGWW